MNVHALGNGVFLGVEVAEEGCSADVGRIRDVLDLRCRQTATGHYLRGCGRDAPSRRRSLSVGERFS